MKKDLVVDPDLHELYLMLEEYKLQYFLYSAMEYHERKIVDLFAKIDNDKSFISRSSLAKGLRYSQLSEDSILVEELAQHRSSLPALML